MELWLDLNDHGTKAAPLVRPRLAASEVQGKLGQKVSQSERKSERQNDAQEIDSRRKREWLKSCLLGDSFAR